MATARVNGIELYYESHGSGFPLVFVHGGFGGLGTGQGQPRPEWLEDFAHHFQVILYDRRSSGRSEFPTTRHTMEQFADDVRELLRSLDLPRAHVWGTSAGAHIALAFGLRHPDAAASLVLADSAPWLTRDQEIMAALRRRIAILENDGAEAAYQDRREHGTVGLNLFAPARLATSESEQRQRDEQRARIQAQLAAVPREERIAKYASELRTYAAYADFDATDRFRELTMPVLILYGTADSVFPDAGWEELALGMPNVTYRAFAGTDHGLTARHPEALDEILAFLREHTPAG